MLPLAAALASPLADLHALDVRPAEPLAGYSREQFGRAWFDVDRNHCDTRNDILARDLVDIERDGCRVLSGLLDDPYTGRLIVFERGPRSSVVQIDHVVALANAWVTGAAHLAPARRLALANDPLNLLAVDGKTNSAKGAQDASEWMPPAEDAWCDYAARQVAVKTRYRLWVTPPERDALVVVLEDCHAE